MSMELVFFQSDGMPDAEILGLLEPLKPNRQRWLAAYHPDSRVRRLALEASGMKVGQGTHLALGLVVLDAYTNNITIGERCSIGAYVTLMSAVSPDNSVLKDHPALRGAIRTEPIKIGDDCWIGTGAILMPGITVGKKSVIGAGAVVTKNVLAGEVVQGVPARVSRVLA